MNEQPQSPSRWANVALVLVIVGALALVTWGIDHYWGGDGVRVAGIAIGIMTIILFVIGLGRLVQADAMRMAMDHHDNILRGIVAMQNADDRGEVARTVASGISGALRSGAQLDRTVLQLAGNLAKQQTGAILDSRRQLEAQQDGAPTWAMHQGADVDGDFKMVQ